MRSCCCSWRLASSIEMLGKVIGMYEHVALVERRHELVAELLASGTADTSANSPMASVDLGLRSATKTNGL